MVDIPLIDRVLYVPDGAGFLPSAVVKHQTSYSLLESLAEFMCFSEPLPCVWLMLPHPSRFRALQKHWIVFGFTFRDGMGTIGNALVALGYCWVNQCFMLKTLNFVMSQQRMVAPPEN